MAMPQRRMIEIDGVTLEVWLAGPGAPVVCQSHAYSVRGPDLTAGDAAPWPWDGSVAGLVGVNPRGVGGSGTGRGPRDFTFRQHLDDLEAVRRRLGAERWVFWGGSAGGCIGLLYALTYPQALSGLIVQYMGPSGRRIAEDPTSDLCPTDSDRQRALARGVGSERHTALLGAVEPPLATAEWVSVAPERWVLTRGDEALVACPTGQQRVWAVFEQFATVFEVEDRLGEIRLPTLIVAGRKDQLIPIAHLDRLHAGIEQSEYLVLEESGHGDVAPESADGGQYRSAVNRFLDRVAK